MSSLSGKNIDFSTDIILCNFEWGFDLTDIKADDWESIIDFLDINKQPFMYDNTWVWHGNNIKIHTGNNPITGEFCIIGKRKPEKDYASYIGVYGSEGNVKRAAELIRMLAISIKEETPNESRFI